MLASAKKLVKSDELDQAAEQFENLTGLFPKSAQQKEAQDQLLRIMISFESMICLSLCRANA